MYICICKGLTENHIEKSIQELERFYGYVNISLIQNYTGAATKCGCCKDQIQQFIKDSQKMVVKK
jgi:bacterioferritin-associated ferredoxin